MATTGDKISFSWEGHDQLVRKVKDLSDLKKKKSLLYSIYSQSATPIVKPYKNALPELNDTRSTTTPDRLYASNPVDGNRIKPGALRESVGKIRSKGHTPAIYIGPRTGKMRAGKRRVDGYYSQFLVFGTKTIRPARNRVLAVMKAYKGPTKARISRRLVQKINDTWAK